MKGNGCWIMVVRGVPHFKQEFPVTESMWRRRGSDFPDFINGE
jgi:hypothetical protein